MDVHRRLGHISFVQSETCRGPAVLLRNIWEPWGHLRSTAVAALLGCGRGSARHRKPLSRRLLPTGVSECAAVHDLLTFQYKTSSSVQDNHNVWVAEPGVFFQCKEKPEVPLCSGRRSGSIQRFVFAICMKWKLNFISSCCPFSRYCERMFFVEWRS